MTDTNGSANAGNPEWINSVPADLKPVVEAKGWKSPNDVLSGYVNLERLVGTKRLEAPQETWDAAKWGEFHKALGVPDDPAGYTLPEGVAVEDQDYLTAAQKAARELGLTPKQFAGMVGWNNQYVGGRAEAMTKGEAEAVAKADADLRKEWGGAYDQKVAAGKTAVAALQGKLGLDAEFLTTIENKIGYAPLLKLFATLADDYGIGRESRAPGQGQPGITPGAASAELRQLNGDADFRKALMDRSHPGHADAMSKWERLIDAGGKLSG